MVRKGSPVQVRLRAPSLSAAHPVGPVELRPIETAINTRFVRGPRKPPRREGVTPLNAESTPQSALRARKSWLAPIVLAFAVGAALALPGGASAARPLTTGFQSDFYQSANPSERSVWYDRTVDAGAGIVRLALTWATMAPNRPADPTNPGSSSYDFTAIDAAVRDAAARNLSVMLNVNGAPDWAEGPGRPADATPTAWKPNPTDLGNFMRAVAGRYNGSFPDPLNPGKSLPPVQAVEVWNEPNTSGGLAPQFNGKTDVAAPMYRDMLNASYDAIKSVNPRMLVVAGGTDPYGDPPGGPYPPGVQRVQPVTFWQDLLCVRPAKTGKTKGKKKSAPPKYVRTSGCNGPVKFDVLSHHPIDNTGKGPLEHGPLPGDASTPDLGRVVNVLRGAEKAGTTLSGKHQVWATEFWWDSNPPNPEGASLATQARWIEQSMFLFWKAGANTAINFVIGDAPARPGVRAGFQGGVYFADGRPKPSLTAFKFPFVTSRIDKRHLEAWGKSPASGQLMIQRQQGSTFRTIKKMQVSKGGVFDTKLTVNGGSQQYRAVVGPNQSLIWKQAAFGTGSSGGGLSGWKVVLIIIGGIAALLAIGTVIRRRQAGRPRPGTTRRLSSPAAT